MDLVLRPWKARVLAAEWRYPLRQHAARVKVHYLGTVR